MKYSRKIFGTEQTLVKENIVDSTNVTDGWEKLFRRFRAPFAQFRQFGVKQSTPEGSSVPKVSQSVLNLSGDFAEAGGR